MTDRIFTQNEVSELLSKAARLEGSAGTRSSGLTLAEVKDAARAAGIDPTWVETALKTSTSTPEPNSYGGVVTSVHRELVLPNPINETQWGRIVSELRRALDGKGTVETIGETRAWEDAPYRVRIENVDGRAIVVADAEWAPDIKSSVWFTAIASLMAVIFGIPAFMSGVDGLIGITVLSSITAIVLASILWSYHRRGPRLGAKLDDAMDQIQRLSKPKKESRRQSAAVDLAKSAVPKAEESTQPQRSILDGAVGYWQGDQAKPDRSRERD